MTVFNGTAIVGIGVLILSVACTSKHFPRQESDDQIRSLCTQEAELLVRPVIVYNERFEKNSGAVLLKADSFIYRCKKHPGWTAVMYPGEGEKVDCNYREHGRLCSVGWVKGELVTSAFE